MQGDDAEEPEFRGPWCPGLTYPRGRLHPIAAPWLPVHLTLG